jgi:hypothetical protein
MGDLLIGNSFPLRNSFTLTLFLEIKLKFSLIDGKALFRCRKVPRLNDEFSGISLVTWDFYFCLNIFAWSKYIEISMSSITFVS